MTACNNRTEDGAAGSFFTNLPAADLASTQKAAGIYAPHGVVPIPNRRGQKKPTEKW